MINQKIEINDLAIITGQPLFKRKIPVKKPIIPNEEKFIEILKTSLKNKILTNDGPLVKKLERKIANLLDVNNCILTSNGTMALQLISKALELKGEVIIPSFTFIATPHSMLWQGLQPVFCDVNLTTNNIDVEKCEKLINEKTSAILGVHLWGTPCEIEKLEKLTNKHGLKLFFDSAHAFGCSYRKKMIGNFGEAEAFSFHATKYFHTFEGGAVTTNDDNLADKIKKLRNFGFIDYDCVAGIGINAKMSEINAAMGLTNLNYIGKTIKSNYLNYKVYKQRIENIKGLNIHEYNEYEKNNYQYIVIENCESITGISRDLIVETLNKENIEARRYFYPGCHKMKPYCDDTFNTQTLPNTEYLAKNLFVLPSGADVDDTVIEGIENILNILIYNAEKINKFFSKAQKY